ncbi:MAG: DUF202 domain-containing protein [Chloroflexi bacterium]|nr:DUF202 domain-containing protein [Chloroflexota bacterium]MBI2980408.1 DUF202 domain-containing protein [Chloroflexota bacterium]
MSQDPYDRFKKEELILRDYLAADRTSLANERTLLSYIRTSVALAAAGGSLIHFLTSLVADIGGGLLLALAAGILGVGFQRFLWYKRRLKNIC